jgi:D-beta-D-heptose 7-phosphate kinase/D-beta-D-heptose 1-phosphate adenosyltransferase
MSDPFQSLFDRSRSPQIMVVGDVILDRYRWGDAERISPEAPIPVLRIRKQEDRLGGAGNVAAMLAALGAKASRAAVTGDDAEARIVGELLHDIQIDGRAVIADPSRPTTLKERLLGSAHQRFPQQMIRVDREDRRPISAELVRCLLAHVDCCLATTDLILLSDYDKGLCGGGLAAQLIAMARAAEVPVVADPVRGVDYRRYAGAACITPNRVEAGSALGWNIETPQDALKAARELLQFGVAAAAVTIDRDGIAWADRDGRSGLFPTRPRQVCDVTGAGDMVLATLGYCLAAGADWPTAIELANLAGGLEVERLGVVPITREELRKEWSAVNGQWSAIQNPKSKIQNSIEDLLVELHRERQAGRRIVMTNGCFDLLHPGHVASLETARKLGDCLVVGLNSDRSVGALKGPGRPVIDQQGRAEMLAALACVDYVVIFDDVSVAPLVQQVQPDVLAKSSEYSAEKIVGHEIVRRHGGHVVAVPMKLHYSTTRLIQKLCDGG